LFRPTGASSNEMYDVTDGIGGSGNENGNAAIMPLRDIMHDDKQEQAKVICVSHCST